MKIGRNDSCPCGSKKKFKRCCLNVRADKHGNAIFSEEFLEKLHNPEPLGKDGILTGRPFISHLWKAKNQRARAVGNTVYLRPPNETFHEFILGLLEEKLEKAWVLKEREKLSEQRNPIIQWFGELAELTPSESEVKDIKQVSMTGGVRALLSTAYDIYSLKHCSTELQQKLINRLKNTDQFQGARYEVAVAGIAARAGFVLQYLNDKTTHCEYVGINKITQEKVAFEAKSHSRKGILGKTVGDDNLENAKIKIGDHIKEALDQAPKEFPFIIFDDLNVPLTPDLPFEQKQWFHKIGPSLKVSGFLDKFNETNLVAVFITNYSWYFHETFETVDKNEVLILNPTTSTANIRRDTLEALTIAARQYGYIPANLEEFSDDQ